MKKAIATKWIKAMRSKKYKQATGALKRENGYCCLGVLCDISKQGEWEEDDGALCYKPREGSSNDDLLPGAVQRWAGMGSDNGEFTHPDNGYFIDLAALNDDGYPELNDDYDKPFKNPGKPLSFARIATLVEKRPVADHLSYGGCQVPDVSIMLFSDQCQQVG